MTWRDATPDEWDEAVRKHNLRRETPAGTEGQVQRVDTAPDDGVREDRPRQRPGVDGGGVSHDEPDLAAPVAPDSTDPLREAAQKTRDLLANYLWNEDDSGDENDLQDAYDELTAILGPSSEQSVGETLAALRSVSADSTDPLRGELIAMLDGRENDERVRVSDLWALMQRLPVSEVFRSRSVSADSTAGLDVDGPIPHTEGATTWDVPWIVSDTGENSVQPRWLVHTAGAAVIADVEQERHARWIVDRWNREYGSPSTPPEATE